MDEYYRNQAGSGIGGFAGQRYQKGDGFFGRLVSGSILPIIRKVLPFLGKTALSTGVNILSDVSTGEKFTSSAKRRLKESGKKIESRAMAKVKEITGSGKKRRQRKVVRKVTANKRKQATKRKTQKTRRKTKKKAIDFL